MSRSLPVLHFDDGSRVMRENELLSVSSDIPNVHSSQSQNPRGSTPITTYYEIDRISDEILSLVIPKIATSENSDGFLVKVALQFPDEILEDAPEVSFLLEDTLLRKHSEITSSSSNEIPLVFVLGDTTYSSCCPDEIGALHLNADVIVHYGTHACLSVSESLIVLYSFGMEEWAGQEECISIILKQMKEDDIKNIILVGERRFQNHLAPMANALNQYDDVKVVVGQVPNFYSKSVLKSTSKKTCCQKNYGFHLSDKTNYDSCCGDDECCGNSIDMDHRVIGCAIGGLHIGLDRSELSDYTLLYIGDDSANSKSRQFLNTVLKCMSPDGTRACWSYNPSLQRLSTDPMSILGVQRHINRRFYLTQKAKLSNIIGILVGTLSQDRFQAVVSSVRKMIEDSGRAAYTFVVGKINVAKLANFGEVDCFVLISCGETSILKDERDFHVPIITPMELEIALGEKEWSGPETCGTDFNDFLQSSNSFQEENHHEESIPLVEHDKDCNYNDTSSDESNDEPYYSMITGTYVSKPLSLNKSTRVGASLDPKNSQITEYKSEAAEYWKKREYKGLEANVGKDVAVPAIMGQTGIASDYGNK